MVNPEDCYRTSLPVLWLALLAAPVTTTAVVPAAIINKQLRDRSRATFETPAQMASALFGGNESAATALQVITALVLLGAMVALVVGVWQMLRGERGGIEVAGSGIFGLLGLTAAVTVVM